MRRVRTGAVDDLPAVPRLLARAAGPTRQRVDCYDGTLVRCYESAGFTRAAPFEVNGRPGRLRERRA